MEIPKQVNIIIIQEIIIKYDFIKFPSNLLSNYKEFYTHGNILGNDVTERNW